uniref:Uncharacterized protein n=1 Tax=Kalanchoe fedtschenkoi TaxID=63787 RepID=A0A7N0TX49_KALFE
MHLLQSLHYPVAGIGDNKLGRVVWTRPHGIHCLRSIRAAQNGRPVDPEKAREALKKLDQQLQYISEKPPATPTKKARDPGFEEFQIREEMPQISGSFLGYTAAALFLFTIFYNIFFYTVIKPAVDLPSDPTAQLGAPK